MNDYLVGVRGKYLEELKEENKKLHLVAEAAKEVIKISMEWKLYGGLVEKDKTLLSSVDVLKNLKKALEELEKE